MEFLLDKIKKNDNEELRLTLQKFRSRHYIDIRTYRIDTGYPSHKGAMIRLDQLSALKTAIATAEKIILENNLI